MTAQEIKKTGDAILDQSKWVKTPKPLRPYAEESSPK
jgi:hypothetical protein